MAAKSESEDVATYQGTIDRDLWEEFKQYVPRTINLDDRINDLIRDWTETQKDREQQLAELEDEHP